MEREDRQQAMSEGPGLRRRQEGFGWIPMTMLAMILSWTMPVNAWVVELDSADSMESPVVWESWPQSLSVTRLQPETPWRWSIVACPSNLIVAASTRSPATKTDGTLDVTVPSGSDPSGSMSSGLGSGVFELRLVQEPPVAPTANPWSWQRLAFWESEPEPALPQPLIAKTWTLIVGDEGLSGNDLIDAGVSTEAKAEHLTPTPNRRLLVRLREQQLSSPQIAKESFASHPTNSPSPTTIRTLEEIQNLHQNLQSAIAAGSFGVVLSAEFSDWWLQRATVEADRLGLQVHLEIPAGAAGLTPNLVRQIQDRRINGVVIHRPRLNDLESDRTMLESVRAPVAAVDSDSRNPSILEGKTVLLVSDQRDGDGDEFAQWAQRWRDIQPNCVVLVSRNRPALSTLSGQFIGARSRTLERSVAGLADGFWLTSLEPSLPQTNASPTSSNRLAFRVLPASWRMGGADQSDSSKKGEIADQGNAEKQAFLHDFCQLVHQRTSDPNSADDWLVIDQSTLRDPVTSQAIAIWRNWLGQSMEPLDVENENEAALARGWRVTSPEGDFLLLVNQAFWPQRFTLLTDSPTSWSFVGQETKSGVSSWAVPAINQTPSLSSASIDADAMSWTVVHTKAPIESPLRFRAEIIEPVKTLETLTKHITHIVERLGLLNEPEPPRGIALDGLPAVKSNGSQSLLQFFSPMSLHRSASISQFPSGGLIRNGDFELDGPSPGVPAWMHAQHPVGAVRVDLSEVSSGKASVRLQAGDVSGTRAWLISPTFPTPTTGRLAVSMAVRALPKDAAPTSSDNSDSLPMMAQVRVAIEGSYQDRPCRKTATIDVPADGRWQPRQMVLEWLDVDPEKHANLRLTIDNLSDEHVWIDEIHVTDWFANNAERAETQSSAYLAVQGLQKSDLTNVSLLLQNFWANQLLQFPANTPSEVTPESSILPVPVWGRDSSEVRRVIPASAHPPVTEVQSSPKQTESEGTRRWKDWLPQPLRF